jgi:hypothetical protein
MTAVVVVDEFLLVNCQVHGVPNPDIAEGQVRVIEPGPYGEEG